MTIKKGITRKFQTALDEEMDAREELETYIKTLNLTKEQYDLLYRRINLLNEAACRYSVILDKA